jgi:uncharacterized protein (TIGR02757 family)
MKRSTDLKQFLDEQVDRYNRSEFIDSDPIQIPHSFKSLQDIEISGFFTATLAWGQRKTIIAKCRELMNLMDNAPHDFVLHHQARDLKRIGQFKHRTFNTTDLLYFIRFFKQFYARHHSLEEGFVPIFPTLEMEPRLTHFYSTFFSLKDYPVRTQKHIATPVRKSACKRINMFLRWMVRTDNRGVDFGLWKTISPAHLICPIDLHVERVARKLKLIKRKQVDWQTAVELTRSLKQFDPTDPVKYDFALFGLGIDPASMF